MEPLAGTTRQAPETTIRRAISTWPKAPLTAVLLRSGKTPSGVEIQPASTDTYACPSGRVSALAAISRRPHSSSGLRDSPVARS